MSYKPIRLRPAKLPRLRLGVISDGNVGICTSAGQTGRVKYVEFSNTGYIIGLRRYT